MVGFILQLLLKWFLQKLKWFLSKTEEENDNQGIWQLLLWVIYSVRNLFSTLWIKILNTPGTSCAAEKFYRLLLRWGRFSGLSHVVSETPIEYGVRLKQKFPRLGTEIEMIIAAVNLEIYGQIPPDTRALACIQSARRRMASPRHWPARMRAWFAGPSMEVRASKYTR
jgi:hypothetical protein